MSQASDSENASLRQTSAKPASNIKRTSSSRKLRESSITDFFSRRPSAAPPSTPSTSPDDSGISTSTELKSLHGKDKFRAAVTTSSSQKPQNNAVASLKALSSPMPRSSRPATQNTPATNNSNRVSSPVEVSSGESVYSVKSHDSNIQVLSDQDPDIQLISSKPASKLATTARRGPIDLCSPEPSMSKKNKSKTLSGAVLDMRSPEPPRASTSKLESPAKSSTLRVESSPSASKALRVLPQGSTSPAASRTLAPPPRSNGSENAASPRRSPRLLSPEPRPIKQPRSSSKAPSKSPMARKRSTPMVPLSSIKPAIEPVSDRKRVIQRDFSVEINLADHPGPSSRHVTASPPKAKPTSPLKGSSVKGKQRMDIDEEDVAIAEMLSPVKRKTPDVVMSPPSPVKAPNPPKPAKLTRLPGESGREFGARLLANRKAASAAATTPDPASKDEEPSTKKMKFSDDMDSDDDLVDAGEAAKKASVAAGKAREEREEAARAAEARLIGTSASTSKSAKDPAPVSRRTSRGRKSQLEEVREEEDPSTKSMLDEWAAGDFGGKGQFSLKALVKERDARVKKGYMSYAEVEAMNLTIEETMGDIEAGSQSKEELDRLRASKGALTKMIGGGNKTNKLLDAVLDEEKEDEAANQAALDARRFWTYCETGEASELQAYTIPEASTYESTPFLDNVIDGLRRGLQNPLAYPCEIALSIGSWVDTYSVNMATTWFFDMAVNPTTSRQLASSIMPTLLTLIRESSKRIGEDASDRIPIELDHFGRALHILGARPDAELPSLFANNGKQSAEGQNSPIAASPLLEASLRKPALVRVLRIAEQLATSGHWSAKSTDTVALAVTFCRMSIDPASAAYRMPLEKAIHALLDSIRSEDIMIPLEPLINLCKDQNRQCQYEMVGILPHRTSADRLLRRWLAWTLLTSRASEVTSLACQHGPPLSPILELFKSPSRDGPFYAQDDFDELTLYYSTNLLQIVVSDMWTDLIRILPVDGNPEGDQLLKQTKKLHDALTNTDRGIRVTARTNNPLRNKARNQITRLGHSLYHQHRTAESSANAARKAAGLIKPKGQQKMNAFFAPTASTSNAASGQSSTAAGVNGVAQADDDELPDV